MSLRYGLDNDGYLYTYAEIARILGVSYERGRQVTQRAERKLANVIRKLRGATRCGK